MAASVGNIKDLEKRLELAEKQLRERSEYLRERNEELRRLTFRECLHPLHSLYCSPPVEYRLETLSISAFTDAVRRCHPHSLRPWTQFSQLLQTAWNELDGYFSVELNTDRLFKR